MILEREQNVRRLLTELTVNCIDTQQYMSDLEPQWAYDTFLRGKVMALARYLELFGRKDLALSVEQFLPLNGNAIEALTFIADYVAPEITGIIASLPPEPTSVATPHYDADQRELWLGDQLVKRFRQPAPNQERVLSAFRELDWPRVIDSPFKDNEVEKFRESIRSLNDYQQAGRIEFYMVGTGESVGWKLP